MRPSRRLQLTPSPRSDLLHLGQVRASWERARDNQRYRRRGRREPGLSRWVKRTRRTLITGKSTVLTTAQGLKIGCVGGSYDQGLYASGEDTGPYSPILSKPSVDAFLANPLFNPSTEPSLASARESAISLPPAFQGVDLLLVSQPPPSLSLLSTSAATLPFPLAEPAAPLAEVVQKSKPRYMFWAEGEGFWEREPWGWIGENGKEERWTRAVKLGALGDAKKARVGVGFLCTLTLSGSTRFRCPLRRRPRLYLPDRPMRRQTRLR